MHAQQRSLTCSPQLPCACNTRITVSKVCMHQHWATHGCQAAGHYALKCSFQQLHSQLGMTIMLTSVQGTHTAQNPVRLDKLLVKTSFASCDPESSRVGHASSDAHSLHTASFSLVRTFKMLAAFLEATNNVPDRHLLSTDWIGRRDVLELGSATQASCCLLCDAEGTAVSHTPESKRTPASATRYRQSGAQNLQLPAMMQKAASEYVCQFSRSSRSSATISTAVPQDFPKSATQRKCTPAHTAGSHTVCNRTVLPQPGRARAFECEGARVRVYLRAIAPCTPDLNVELLQRRACAF